MSRRHPHLVYFIKPVGMGGPVKIGCSAVPDARLKALAAWSPTPLEIVAMVPGNYEDEQYLHRCFADQHSHHEWFNESPRLTEFIARVTKEGSINWVRSEIAPVGAIRRTPKVQRVPEYRVGYRAYCTKVRWAETRLRKLGVDAWRAPRDVGRIMDEWNGRACWGVEGVRPTDAEFTRLDEYLGDPSAHSVTHSERFQDLKAAA